MKHIWLTITIKNAGTFYHNGCILSQSKEDIFNKDNWYLSLRMTRNWIKPLKSIKFKFAIRFKYRFDFPVKNGVNMILCDAENTRILWTLFCSTS